MTRTAVLPLCALVLLAAGCASGGGRLAVREDNDVFNLGRGFDTDQDYTQGGEAALTLTEEDTPAWARDVAAALPLFSDGSRLNLAVTLGQEIYTPVDIFRKDPDPEDRPYSGYLYLGLALQGRVLDEDPVARRDRMDLLEVDLGVVGPSALGEWAQNTTHEILDLDKAEGWDHQLKDEPALQAAWTRRWRAAATDLGSTFGADFLPGIRARAGTVRVDGTADAIARLGFRLPRDFGLSVVDGSGMEKGAAPPPPWIALVGTGGFRGVLHDISLGGGTFRNGPRVTNTNLVLESSLGLSAGWGPLQVHWAQNFVSPQFREDRRYHSWTTLMVSWTWHP